MNLSISKTIRRLNRRVATDAAAKGGGVPLDKLYQTNLVNVNDPTIKESDTPLYLHIPKTGGTAAGDYYACLGLVTSENLAISEGQSSHTIIDTHSVAGIQQAKQLQVVQRGIADMIITPLLPAAVEMFDSDHQARVFGLFRHPIEREVSRYYYRQIASWEP
eukprot:3173997-Ditylum_brightwellii.AAC.1